MLGVVYENELGFGSIGWLTEIKYGSVSVADPILGDVEVLESELVHLFDTESGSLAGFTVAEPEGTSALPLAANPGLVLEDGERISGYPLAWERVRRWREGAALDWRTVALVGVFCLTTVQRPIETAERAYRVFGPTLLRTLDSGLLPTERETESLVRAAEVGGLEKTLARNIVAMLEYSPWLAERLHGSRDYTRGFRNRVALTRVPMGLSLAKLSFLVSILGRDAACIDARLYVHFFRGDRDVIRRTMKTVQKAKGKISTRALQRYQKLEDRLRNTDFWDTEWPMPFAQAQWRMWESLGDEPAEHGALWDVVPQPEPSIRLIKNRVLK